MTSPPTTTRPTRPRTARWRVRLADPVLRLLARCTPWVERELLGLHHVVRRGAVCLDVGAATGYYSVALSRLAGPSGAVHSIEPLVVAHPTLAALLGVRRRPIALGATPGRHWMSVPLRDGRPVTGRAFLTHGASGLGSNEEFDDHLEIRVQAETLDTYCADAGIDRLDFVKLDVEGGELAVLRGGTHTIDRHHPTILVELEERHTRRYAHTPDEVVDWLTTRGYRMHHWRAGRWHPTTRVTPVNRNYLFVAGRG